MGYRVASHRDLCQDRCCGAGADYMIARRRSIIAACAVTACDRRVREWQRVYAHLALLRRRCRLHDRSSSVDHRSLCRDCVRSTSTRVVAAAAPAATPVAPAPVAPRARRCRRFRRQRCRWRQWRQRWQLAAAAPAATPVAPAPVAPRARRCRRFRRQRCRWRSGSGATVKRPFPALASHQGRPCPVRRCAWMTAGRSAAEAHGSGSGATVKRPFPALASHQGRPCPVRRCAWMTAGPPRRRCILSSCQVPHARALSGIQQSTVKDLPGRGWVYPD